MTMNPTPPQGEVASPLRRKLKRLAASAAMITTCIGAIFGGQSVGSAQTSAQSLNYRAPSSVPPAWNAYAALVQSRFREWLGADDDVAYRFHLFLENSAVSADGPLESLVVKVWVKPDGKVEQVAFSELKDKQADEDLHNILARGDIGEPPPPDMLQPLHLRLALRFPS